MSQAIEGHAATIAQFKIPDAEEESKLLVYAVRNKTSEPGKVSCTSTSLIRLKRFLPSKVCSCTKGNTGL